MVASRSWSLLLAPGGLVAGHAVVCALGGVVGVAPIAGWDGSVLRTLLCLSVPLSLAMFTRALISGLPNGAVPSLFRVLAVMQVGLFLAIELVGRGVPAGVPGLVWMLMGLVAQLAVAAFLCALVRAVASVGARLRRRRRFTPGLATPRHFGGISRVRLRSVVGLGSLSRRGPPPLATP